MGDRTAQSRASEKGKRDVRLLAADLLEPGLHGSLAALAAVGCVSIANPAVAELFASQNNPATTFAIVAFGAVEIGAMVGVALSFMRLGWIAHRAA